MNLKAPKKINAGPTSVIPPQPTPQMVMGGPSGGAKGSTGKGGGARPGHLAELRKHGHGKYSG